MEAPRLNETWHVQWGEAVGKKYNILVIINEDKRKFNPPNWRCNNFICEHKGTELIVSGNNFIEKYS